jgi:hypothetical protein
MYKPFLRDDDLDQAQQAEVLTLAAAKMALLAWLLEQP